MNGAFDEKVTDHVQKGEEVRVINRLTEFFRTKWKKSSGHCQYPFATEADRI